LAARSPLKEGADRAIPSRLLDCRQKVGKSNFLIIELFIHMTTLVKIHRKGQMTLPRSFRAAMGVSEGSVVELSLKNGKAVITPKVVIDRSQFRNADDEYTPAQRRIIDRGIGQSRKEYRQGKFSPFETVEEFLADLHKASAKLSAKKSKHAGK